MIRLFPGRARPVVLLCLLCAFVVSGACTSPPSQLSIEGPSAELSPVFLGVASVYLTVRNGGGKDALVAAHAAVPNALVELHDMQNNRMAKVERIAVPARGELKLRPGSWHLMVFNLPRAMKEGDELALTLRFERSGEQQVRMKLERAGAVQPSP
jgi:copper(I)-binding protein